MNILLCLLDLNYDFLCFWLPSVGLAFIDLRWLFFVDFCWLILASFGSASLKVINVNKERNTNLLGIVGPFRLASFNVPVDKRAISSMFLVSKREENIRKMHSMLQ